MDRLEDQAATLARVWVDTLSYALTVTAISTLVAFVLGVATGGGFVRVKLFLFVLGWLLMSVGTAKLWPSRRGSSELPSRNWFGFSFGSDDDEPETVDREDDSRRLRESTQRTEPGNSSLPSLGERSSFQELVGRLPPSRWVRPPRPENRMTTGSKLFLASLFVFALSYVLERFFGVV